MNDLERYIKQFNKERDKAAISYDVKTFRAFYDKWAKLGAYDVPLPASDVVIEIIMRKMVYHSNGFSSLQKHEAAKWLSDHGCTTSLQIDAN